MQLVLNFDTPAPVPAPPRDVPRNRVGQVRWPWCCPPLVVTPQLRTFHYTAKRPQDMGPSSFGICEAVSETEALEKASMLNPGKVVTLGRWR